MYKIKVNDNHQFETEMKDRIVLVDGAAVEIDLIAIGGQRFHMILDKKSYLAELVEMDESQKKIKIRVNSNIYDLDVKDQYDELLKNLGMDNLNSSKLKEIKAPMPGLVLNILVKEGDFVKKGENLLVLEAMKMENMIKAPADLKILKILIKSGDKLDKNQVIISLY